MGRHAEVGTTGSLRAVVLTITASVLLVVGGVAILWSASDLRVGPPGRVSQTVAADGSPGVVRLGQLRDAGELDELEQRGAAWTDLAAIRLAMGREVVALVDAERRREGCAPLSPSLVLRRAAQLHTADMADAGYLSLTSPSGVTLLQRARDLGYAGPMVGGSVSVDHAGPEGVVHAWLGVARSRTTLLDCSYNQVGVGFATTDANRTYWTVALGG